METVDDGSVLDLAAACLDCGGESGEVLLAALESFVADLAPGQILQVISRHPDALTDIPVWCRGAGHQIAGIVQERDTTIWIRKSAYDAR